MKTQATRSLALTVWLSAVSVIPAAAGEISGWFAGIDVRGMNRALEPLGLSSRVDDTDVGQRLRGEYQFSSHWGIEMGYADRPNLSSTDGGLTQPGPFSGSQKAKGWQLSGVGTLPLGAKFGLFGRVGAFRGDVDLDTNLGSAEGGARAYYGLGLKYDLSTNLRLQGGWDRYRMGAGRFGQDADLDLLSIGLKYRF